MEIDKSKFKVWTWKQPLTLLWLINPVIAINELFLGQRIPKIMLVEKNSSKLLIEKTKVPCPHCKTIHSGLKWSTKNNAFKNWFGLYCDNCGKTTPCLTNFTSYLLLALTFPIWIWFKDKWKKAWLKNQPERYKNLDLENVPSSFEGYGWVRKGLNWGLFMFIFMTLIAPLIFSESITLTSTIIKFFGWAIAGLIYGYTMKLLAKRTNPK